MSVINVTGSNFENVVLNSERAVLIDFWAPWCGPCRTVSPIVDELSEDFPQILVCKVNVDEEPELASRFGVASIPTLIVMKNGEIVESSVGARPKKQIAEMLEKL